MNIVRQRPVLFAVIFTIAVIAAFAWFLTHRQPVAAVEQPAGVTAPAGEAEILSSLNVSLTVRRHDPATPAYEVAIAIEGDKTFTMPVRFIRGMQPAQVSPADAAKLMDAWVKARATGIAQFGVVTPDHGPYLLIDVDSPGAR
jgi:hypothetical protein